MPQDLPKISVVIPIRNEEEFIGHCLKSVVNQDYSRELVEIIVVDGGSTDRSTEIVEKLRDEYSNIRLLGGPGVNCPAAMNLGIEIARGLLVAKIDGHGYVAPDFLREGVKYLMKEPDVKCAGGPIQPVAQNRTGKANALARSSCFGVGKGVYSSRRKWQFTDTVQCGIYRKDIFDEVGLFDESLQFGEDEELNWRIRKKGYKILSTSDIRFFYYPRKSFSSLIRQYYNYGMARIRVIQKHPQFMRIKHIVPAGFILGLAGSGILAVVSHFFLAVFLSIVSIYLFVTLGASIMICRKEGWEYLGLLPVSFGALHIGYGTGFLLGTVEWLLFNRRQ